MSRAKFPPRFKIGDTVRVKLGVIDPDFPDIPLGGWSGTISEFQDDDPRLYLIKLNDWTLNNIDPIYQKRCERDGLDASQIWLLEQDLEVDDGTSVDIEPPTNIITKPLSMDDQDDRIRAVFGLTYDDVLPSVDNTSLRVYHDYLAANLSFPFKAHYSQETGIFRSNTRRVTVLALSDVDDTEIDDMYGLCCSARIGWRTANLPLGEIEVQHEEPNQPLVEDYCYWFWNWR